MTRQPEGSTPGAAPEQKEKTAAVLFAGFMTLALGGAGLLIAALAVGAERAWSGGASERTRSGERKRGWLSEQRAWLDADHKQRVAGAAAREAWLDSGADPAVEPKRPSRAKRVGGGIRRLIAQLAVAGSDFTGGFRDGWKAADKTRKGGGGFKDVAGTRPGGEVCSNCKRAETPVVESGLCADCAASFRQPHNEPAPSGKTAEQEQACRNCRRPGPVDYDGVCSECRRPTARSEPSQANGAKPSPRPRPTPTQRPDPKDRQASPADSNPKPKEKPMTTGSGPLFGTQSPQQAAESNATVLRAKLLSTKSTLSAISDLTDQLAKARTVLDTQVRDATEFSVATGQSMQARAALDESSAVAAQMGQHLGSFSEGAVSAEEQVRQASDGLRVAENAEDELRSAGADGRAVAPAGANA